MLKDLLNAIHDVVHKIIHIVLIPVMVVLKSTDAGIKHLISELSKV